MLTLALLLAAIGATPKPASDTPLHAACPGVSTTAVLSALVRTCPALEISGSVDATGVRLDPAFNVNVSPAELSRTAPGNAVLTGFGADGRILFSFPLEATGPFRFYLPLAPALAQAVQRIQLGSASGIAEQAAAKHGEPEAEIISVDDSHILFAWNARDFPAVRIANAPGLAPLAYGRGSSTYEQMTVSDTSRRISVEFSDGVRSATRTFRVFGR